MSISFNVGGIPGAPVTATLGIAEADILAPPAGLIYFVTGFNLVNTDSTARIVDVYWNDGTTSYQFYKKSVPITDTVEFSNLMIPLVEAATNGQLVAKKIRAKCATAAVVLMTVSYTIVMPQQNA